MRLPMIFKIGLLHTLKNKTPRFRGVLFLSMYQRFLKKFPTEVFDPIAFCNKVRWSAVF